MSEHTHCYTYADSDRPASNEPHENTDRLDPVMIRQIYRYAEYWNDDGTKVAASGYEPDDRIGHAVINVVQGLCDEVIRLRTLLANSVGGATDTSYTVHHYPEGEREVTHHSDGTESCQYCG